MLDIELIRSDPEFVRTALLKRIDDVDLNPILEADALRRKLATEVDGARSERNRQAKEIGKLKASGADIAEVQKQAAALGDQVTAMQAALTEAEKTLSDLLMGLPNLPDERSPAGGKEANQVVRTWGKQPDLGDKPLDHVELCTRLGLIDYARGVELGGNGYWIYTGQGAALEWALLDFFNREHYAAGYQFMLPPHLLTEESGYAAGQFPKFHDDVFHLREEEGGRKSFLLPTSETAIVNVYRDEILPADMLPVKAFAYSPCYRREAGSYRSEERGSIRGHQPPAARHRRAEPAARRHRHHPRTPPPLARHRHPAPPALTRTRRHLSRSVRSKEALGVAVDVGRPFVMGLATVRSG